MKDVVKNMLKFGISVLDKIIPKQKNLIIFGARGGSMYYDNSRYLFEYMLEHHPEFECIWLSINESVIDKVNRLRLKFTVDKLIAYYPRKGVGLWKFLRAKFCVMSHGYADFGLYVGQSSPKKVIFLWHGLPIKNIMYASERGEHPRKPYKIDLFPVNSRFEKYVFSYCFGIPAIKKVFKVWGTPRLSILHENIRKNGKLDKKRLLKDINVTDFPVEKLILYAPTYREETITKFFPFEYDKDQLDKILEDEKALILLRAHVSDINVEFFDESRHKRIVYWNQDEYPDLYDYLHLIDVVIIDYSSLYFECVYLDIPIIFLPYDRYEYEDKWGFLYPYDSIMVGREVMNLVGVMEVIQTKQLAFNYPYTEYLERRRIKGLFHETSDGRSCERITEWIQANQ